MKHLFLLFSVFSILLNCSSCSTSNFVTTHKIAESKIYIPDDVKVINILDRSKEKNIRSRLKSGIIYQNNKALLRRVSGILPVKSSIDNRALKHVQHGQPAPKFTANEVKEYIAQGDALLCLELIQIQERRDYKSFTKHQLDENGKDYYVEAIKGTKNKYIETLWSLYGSDGNIIFQQPYLIEDIYEAQTTKDQDINVKLDTAHVVSDQELVDRMIARFKKDINPVIERHAWVYYKKGHDLIKKSAIHIKKGEYESAARMLENNFDILKKKSDIKRGYVNLVIALYHSGQVDRAFTKIKEAENRGYHSTSLKSVYNKMQ